MPHQRVNEGATGLFGIDVDMYMCMYLRKAHVIHDSFAIFGQSTKDKLGYFPGVFLLLSVSNSRFI